MKINLTYFKPSSGKLYSRGDYESNYKFGFEVYGEVALMAKTGKLPGLIDTNRETEFIVLIEAEDIPSQLILPPRMDATLHRNIHELSMVIADKSPHIYLCNCGFKGSKEDVKNHIDRKNDYL
jgi:hypothetical protein